MKLIKKMLAAAIVGCAMPAIGGVALATNNEPVGAFEGVNTLASSSDRQETNIDAQGNESLDVLRQAADLLASDIKATQTKPFATNAEQSKLAQLAKLTSQLQEHIATVSLPGNAAEVAFLADELLSLQGQLAAVAQKLAPPNIVVILADDLGYGDIGPYGQTKIRTPHLDELARQGVRFTQHYSGSTVCAPSRAALLTGINTARAQIRGNVETGDYTDENEGGQMPLKAGTTTLPGLLRNAGYSTAIVGKWGLGGRGTEGEPNKHGFDYAFGYLDQKQAHNYYPTHLWENGVNFPLNNTFFIPHVPANQPWRSEDIYTKYMGPDYAPDRLIGKAEEFIAKKGPNKPFFLYYTPTLPHAALQIPRSLVEQYSFPETPLGRTGYTPHPTPRAARAAMVTRLDYELGRIRAAIERAGKTRNTLIIFTSDNGPASEGGADLGFFNASGGFRGEKRDLYEGGVRVPFIAYWPGRTKAATNQATICANWDLLPTLAEIGSASVPTAIDGKSFLPALLGATQIQTGPLYWEFHERPSQAARDGKWKAVRYQPAGFDTTRPIELYNLDTDPFEKTNVASTNPTAVDQLKKILDARTRSPTTAFNFGR